MYFSGLIKWFFLLTIIAFFSFLTCLDYLQAGFPYTHDGENHLARFANYKIALKEGQLPPRLAPNLLNHYGYPVFNYNYPLANILSLPFSLFGFNYETTFKIILLGSLIFGGIGVILWLNELFLTEKKQKSSLIFALGVYYSSYYLINALLFRGNIGEVLAFALFPWVLFCLKKRIFSPFFILILTAFLLSHNIMALFGGLIGLVLFIADYKNHRAIGKKELAFFSIALGLTLWFWWPALLELNLVAAGHSDLVSNATAHFPTLNQLLFSTLQFGFSYPGSVDSLSFSLGILQWIVVANGLLTLICLGKKGIKTFPSLFFILFCLTILFQLSISLPAWQTLPFLNLLQFPWRLSFFASILLLPIATWAFNRANKIIKVFFLGVLCLQLIAQLNLKPLKYFHKTETEYDLFPQTTSTSNENKPQDFKYLLIGDWRPSPTIFIGSGEIKIINWTGSARSYELSLSTHSLILEPTAYFRGWQTQALNLENNDSFLVEYYDDDEIAGRLAYKLPAGQWLITSKFTQNTTPRLVGNAISLLSLLGLIIYFFKYQQTQQIK